jgi:small subunit ribosomal protein S2
MNDKTFDQISKRERLQIAREKANLEKNLGSIADLTRLPSAIFVVDILKEHIAVAEAKRLNIPTFAMVDTNANPELIDFPIPANDDASKSITIIVEAMVKAIEEGLAERKFDKDNTPEEDENENRDDVNFSDEDSEEEGKKGKRAPKGEGENREGGNRRPRKTTPARKK